MKKTKKSDTIKASFDLLKDGTGRLEYEDGTIIGISKQGTVSLFFPRAIFTNSLCIKEVDGKKYWSVTFIPAEMEIFLTALSKMTIGKGKV